MSQATSTRRSFRLRFRSGLWAGALLTGMFLPAAHASGEAAGDLRSEAAVLASSQALRVVVYDFRSVLLAGTPEAVPFAAERLADPTDFNAVQVRLPMQPATLRAPVADASARTGGGAAGLSPARAGGMTLLDRALMVLFAVGLIAYQLGRKQRVLRHTTLATGSL